MPLGIRRFTRFTDASFITSIRSNWRFTRADFFRRLWLFMPFACMILPVAVTLKRRFAPLCVLSLPCLPTLFLSIR